MLSMFNNYGMSHVCAQDVFKNLEVQAGRKNEEVLGSYAFSYPFLDAYYTLDNFEDFGTWNGFEYFDTLDNRINDYDSNMEFYFRGYNPDSTTEYQNLFEVLLFLTSQELDGNFLFCLSTLFGKDESTIYEDFLHLRELVEVEESFVNRTNLPTYARSAPRAGRSVHGKNTRPNKFRGRFF